MQLSIELDIIVPSFAMTLFHRQHWRELEIALFALDPIVSFVRFTEECLGFGALHCNQ